MASSAVPRGPRLPQRGGVQQGRDILRMPSPRAAHPRAGPLCAGSRCQPRAGARREQVPARSAPARPPRSFLAKAATPGRLTGLSESRHFSGINSPPTFLSHWLGSRLLKMLIFENFAAFFLISREGGFRRPRLLRSGRFPWRHFLT